MDEVTRVRGKRISEKAQDCLEANSRDIPVATLGGKLKSESLGTSCFLCLDQSCHPVSRMNCCKIWRNWSKRN